jgi:hypothetical protein
LILMFLKIRLSRLILMFLMFRLNLKFPKNR